jgi:hypothetical protein
MILNLNDLRKIITKIRFGRKRIYELYFTGRDLKNVVEGPAPEPAENPDNVNNSEETDSKE